MLLTTILDCIYVPGECSRHLDVENFDKIQNDVLNFKNCDSNIILLGDFNARTVVSEEFVELDNEHNETPFRGNRDKITNTNGRFQLDLCKTTEMRIVNGRIGSDKGIEEFTCKTHNGKKSD